MNPSDIRPRQIDWLNAIQQSTLQSCHKDLALTLTELLKR